MNKYKFFVIAGIVVLVGILCGFALINFSDITASRAYLESSRYSVSATVDGTVKSVLVKKDDAVKKGQLLAEISVKSKSEDTSVKENSAAVYKTKLDEAEQNHTNSALMYKDGVISQQEYDKSLEKLVSARKLYDNSKAQPSAKTVEVTEKIFAPIDGVLEISYVEKGDSVQKGKRIFLIDTDELKVMAFFDAKYKKALKAGSKAVIKSDKYKDKTFDGVIEYVNDSAKYYPDKKEQLITTVIKFNTDITEYKMTKEQHISVSLKR